MTKWARFTAPDGAVALGQVEGDSVAVHTGLPWAQPQATGRLLPLAGLAWLPPCAPGKIIGLWNNFRAAAEKNRLAHPTEPLYFLKAPDCGAAHQQAVPAAAPDVGRVVYEGELAIVIGRMAHRIAREEAASCIFGYTCANDITAIELLVRDPSFMQWTRAKSLPGFGALGPYIDTSFNPAGAMLRTLVGGRERQNYALDDMFFAPSDIVWRLSQDLLLAPGDVILCGTSLGAMPMKQGTTVDVVIDGLGTLTNTYG